MRRCSQDWKSHWRFKGRWLRKTSPRRNLEISREQISQTTWGKSRISRGRKASKDNVQGRNMPVVQEVE